MIILVFGLIATAVVVWRGSARVPEGHLMERHWSGYQAAFIASDGRVIRRREGDTVSEGQAYAMLWAVWMRDKETFDRCYQWTERHLSRAGRYRDHLLAWHWKDGEVTDWMPASDADIDYALSLIFADRLWKGTAPGGMEDYGQKAGRVLTGILNTLTVARADGHRYLLPWIVESGQGPIPQNLSYYAPGHFRVFFETSGDPRWMELVDTTYAVLSKVTASTGGTGLVPDWFSLTDDGAVRPLDGKNTAFGWESVRVPIRIAMDRVWFSDERAHDWLSGPIARFAGETMAARGRMSAEYFFDGRPKIPEYENPLFYAAFILALRESGSPLAGQALRRMERFRRSRRSGILFGGRDAYFENSLIWWVYALEYPDSWSVFLKGR